MIPARRGRLLLAMYVDLLILRTPFTLGVMLLRDVLPASNLPSWVGGLIALLLAELVMLGIFRTSPGRRLLGITYGQAEGGRTALVVDPDLKKRESWATMLLAIVLLNQGAKDLVRWTQWHTPLPAFGFAVGNTGSIAFEMVLGVAGLYLGAEVLRARKREVVTWGFFYCGVMLLMLVANWSAWDGWIEREVHNRRAFQGLPVRDGEVEFMQGVFAPGMAAFITVLACGFVVLGRRIASIQKEAAQRGTLNGFLPSCMGND